MVMLSVFVSAAIKSRADIVAPLAYSRGGLGPRGKRKSETTTGTRSPNERGGISNGRAVSVPWLAR